MRYILITAVITLLLAGAVFTASSQAGQTPQLQPLSARLAGRSVSQTDGDVWFYWEITNPNGTPLGAKIEIAEHDEEGNFLGVRTEKPCSPEALPDIFRQMTMVPAKGSIVIFYPPIYAQEHHEGEITVSIQENCELQTFWGYYPTSEVSLVGSSLTPEGDLRVTVAASGKLVGSAFAQIQVAFLNEAGEVVKTRFTLAGEVIRLHAGDEATVEIHSVNDISFASYEVNVLGLTNRP